VICCKQALIDFGMLGKGGRAPDQALDIDWWE